MNKKTNKQTNKKTGLYKVNFLFFISCQVSIGIAIHYTAFITSSGCNEYE